MLFFPRIVDLPTFVAINGRSPLCDVIGFTPERDSVDQLIDFLS